MDYHNIIMFIIMFLAGTLSTMNLWVDTWDDMRFHLNDVYMIVLMSGWSFLLMGVYYMNVEQLLIGVVCVIAMVIAIRTQFMISQDQFLRGMIPHHSMAIFMSKKLLTKKNTITQFVKNIIVTQEKEIRQMKNLK
jgi:uncharacterized protein (DUF305 family)